MRSCEELRPQVLRGVTVLLAVVLACIACSPGPTAEDLRQLEELEERFGDRYRFAFERDLYLRAQATADASPSEEEARAIYRAFWMEDESLRIDTRYVYLNIYDQSGRFAFQIAWDPERQELVRSSAEHY